MTNKSILSIPIQLSHSLSRSSPDEIVINAVYDRALTAVKGRHGRGCSHSLFSPRLNMLWHCYHIIKEYCTALRHKAPLLWVEF